MDSTILMNDDEEEEEGNAVDGNTLQFIRSFFLNRVLGKNETKTLYRSIFKTNQDFQEVLHAINNVLEKSKLQIELTTCEVTGNEYYVLISNFFKKDLVWPNNVYTDNQLDYFQSILKQILVSENGAVTSMECLNMTTKLSKKDAQDFLIDLTESKLLTELPDGKMTLSPLTICELYPYFEHHFRDALASCEICKKNIVYSVLCPSCAIRFHKHCLSKYKSQMKKPKCPKCNITWNDIGN